MLPAFARDRAPGGTGHAIWRWFAGWWGVVYLGALVLVLALSPSTYHKANRRAIARHVYADTAPSLLWYTALAALISLVLIRIVVVTAQSYGLTQYALEMVVRVLVLELIPVTAAVFALLRCTLPNGAEISALLPRGGREPRVRHDADFLQREVLPRVASGVFCVLMLAAASSTLALLLAYLDVFGFTTEGFVPYTRQVGRVFNAPVTMIFTVKTLLLAFAVALTPIAVVLYDQAPGRARDGEALRALVRVFLLMLLIEAASLLGNYS